MASTIATLLLTLGWTAVCTAASGPGIGIKIGAQTITDPVDLDKTTRARLELEIASPLLWDEHVDFALGFGGSYLGSHTESYTDTVDGTYIDDLYTDRLSLFDIRLAARLYPLGDSSRIRPYIGAGVGYFWFRDDWENEYSDTFEDPHFPGGYGTVYDHAEGDATLANALSLRPGGDNPSPRRERRDHVRIPVRLRQKGCGVRLQRPHLPVRRPPSVLISGPSAIRIPFCHDGKQQGGSDSTSFLLSEVRPASDV